MNIVRKLAAVLMGTSLASLTAAPVHATPRHHRANVEKLIVVERAYAVPVAEVYAGQAMYSVGQYAGQQIDVGAIVSELQAIRALMEAQGGARAMVKDQTPLSRQHCFKCHSGDSPKGHVDLTGEISHELFGDLTEQVLTTKMPKDHKLDGPTAMKVIAELEGMRPSKATEKPEPLRDPPPEPPKIEAKPTALWERFLPKR